MRKVLALVSVLLASLTLPAGAFGDPAVHDLPPDESFTDVNPCTGQRTTITQHFTKFVLREGPDAAGGFHVTGTAVGTLTTTDGFAGRFTFWFGFNGSESGTSEETFTNSNTLTNGTGQRVVITVSSHLTEVDGEVVAEHEVVNFKCVGKPA